jgi:hypothetical protein
MRLKASETESSNCGRKTATRKSSRNDVTVDETNEALDQTRHKGEYGINSFTLSRNEVVGGSK